MRGMKDLLCSCPALDQPLTRALSCGIRLTTAITTMTVIADCKIALAFMCAPGLGTRNKLDARGRRSASEAPMSRNRSLDRETRAAQWQSAQSCALADELAGRQTLPAREKAPCDVVPLDPLLAIVPELVDDALLDVELPRHRAPIIRAAHRVAVQREAVAENRFVGLRRPLRERVHPRGQLHRLSHDLAPRRRRLAR